MFGFVGYIVHANGIHWPWKGPWDAIPTDITDEYEVGKTLGTGHFSKVKLGTDKKTGQKVAIKIIVKPVGKKIATIALVLLPIP